MVSYDVTLLESCQTERPTNVVAVEPKKRVGEPEMKGGNRKEVINNLASANSALLCFVTEAGI